MKIHWQVISGFFAWCRGSKRITENPIPNTREFPQFRIKVKKPEVIPPTAKEVQRVISAVDGMEGWDAARRHKARIFILTQRFPAPSCAPTIGSGAIGPKLTNASKFRFPRP